MQKKIVESLKNAKNILICMHVDPDGDTVGSAFAFARAIEILDKKFTLYSYSKIPEIYSFLTKKYKVNHLVDEKEKFDILLALDCADSKRIPKFDILRKSCNLVVNIDHHFDNTFFGDLNCIKPISSTGEIAYEVIKKLKVGIDEYIASAIFSAIITDTGNFKYSNVTSKVFNICAELVKHGANPHFISMQIYESKSKAELKVLSKAFANLKYDKNGQLAYTFLTQKDIKKAKALEEDMSGVADSIRSIKDVDIVVFLRETKDGKIKVNLRSKQKNVQKIAKEFGGGGHLRAAGIIMEGPLSRAKKLLLSTIKKRWTQL